MPAEPSTLATPYRSHTCGDLRAEDAGATSRLSGWVHRRRDYGKLIFIDLRDRHGITQVVVDAADAPEAHEQASRVRPEFVITVEGEVELRQPGQENARLATGAVELQARSVTILNEAKTPPFYINDPDATIDETLRLKYRYLDIRREAMQGRLLLRSRLVQAIREAHHAAGFVEVETPNLIKSTPEGARDFIVPSRLQPGTVYALPQSPQQLKQLLMVGGHRPLLPDRPLLPRRGPPRRPAARVHAARPRDELRRRGGGDGLHRADGHRRDARDGPGSARSARSPFPVFEYEEAMERFGSDKPDLRFAMELFDLAPALIDADGAPASGFRVFDETLGAGGRVKGITAPGMAGATRREIDELTEQVKRFGAKGLVHLAVQADGELHGPIAKFLSADTQAAVKAAAGAREGDLILVVADSGETTNDVLGRLRVDLGASPGTGRSRRAGLLLGAPLPDVPVGRAVPALGRDAQPVQRRGARGRGPARRPPPVTSTTGRRRTRPDARRRCSTTSPSTAGSWVAARSGSGSRTCWPGASTCRATRGSRCGSASVRCSRRSSTARRRTVASPSASTAGPPCSSYQTNIREVMAFPKTQSGTDLMLEAPSAPDEDQYEELGLRFVGLPAKG